MDDGKCRANAEDKELVKNLLKCIDDLMPGIGHVVMDIGFLNETLMAAEARLREED